MAELEEVPAIAKAIPEPSSTVNNDSEPLSNHPLSLSWTFGFNSSLPVHNLSDGTRKMVCYVSSHVGVLFDISHNKQTLLQGHSHCITTTAVSGNRRWVVTADTGPNNTLIVWDSHSGVPVCTLFEGLGGGTAVAALSPDAKYLATLSTDTPQVVSVWDWSSGSDTPLCTSALNVDHGTQYTITFHSTDSHQLVSNSQDSVLFYSWKEDKLEVHSTPVSDKDFNRAVGVLNESVFLPGTEQALTGTSEGCGVVWTPIGKHNNFARKPEKLTRLHESPVTVITTVDRFVVTGDSAGRINFFDSSLKLLHWFSNSEQYGHIVSLSFAYQEPKLTERHQYPKDATLSEGPFLTPDFTTSSTTALITHTTANGSLAETVLSEMHAPVTALCAHPSLSRLAVAGSSLRLWDYSTKQVLAVTSFTGQIQCMKFDPKGDVIAVGFTDGRLCLFDALTLNSVRSEPFHFSRDSVTYLSFSQDRTYLATADADCCVSVYMCVEGVWSYLAKHRSHHMPIVGLLFGVELDTPLPRLLSLGEDRNIVEYDLAGSSENDLKVRIIERVEQSATPTAFDWYPSLTAESFILLANDEYKLKLFNSTTKMCRRTSLGPTFGSPLKKVLLLPEPVVRGGDGEEVRRYLAYINEDKVGLLLLPHDGNPHNSSCLLAHPSKVSDMACSYDGAHLFTAGGDDRTVSMWTTNTSSLEALSLLGGPDLEPFYFLLEGGREGEFFKDLEEFFYYAQIRSQGVESTADRQVSCTVPVDQIPDIMRAIGYYPSDEEVENMVNEVKFSDYVDSKNIKTRIDLGDTIKLYINHRPAFGISPTQFQDAFKMLGQRSGGSQQWTVDRQRLLELLQEKGEHFSESELVECLMTLLGGSDNPEVEGSYTVDPHTALEELPQTLSARHFAEDLLGLETTS